MKGLAPFYMLENMRINAANEIDDLFLIPTANGAQYHHFTCEHAHKLKINETDDLFLIPTASGGPAPPIDMPMTSTPLSLTL